MPISPQQISSFTQKAKSAGYSDDEIAAEISRKTYEATQQPAAAPISNPMTEKPPSLGEKALNFGKSLIQPSIDFVKKGTADKKSKYEGKNLKERIKTSLSPKEVISDLPVVGNFIENKDNKLKFDKEGAKATANVASFMVPFGKGAGVIKKVLAPGAAVGALSGASEKDATAQSVATDATLGATGAGALHGAGKLVSKGFEKVTKKLPERLMESVFKEPMKDTRAAVRSGESLGKQALKKGTKGLTDEQIYESSVSKLNEFEDLLQGQLSESKRIIPIGDIKQSVAELIKKYASAGNTSAVSNITNRLEALEQYHGKSIPVSVANELKRTLYDEARNGYGQLASENIEGVKAIAKGLKEAIANKVPGADAINKELSFHGRVADSTVDKLARGGRNNVVGLSDAPLAATALFPGMQVPAIAAFAAKKALGSTGGKKVVASGLDKLGKIGEPISKISANPVVQDVSGQVKSRVGESVGDIQLPVEQQPHQSPNDNEYQNNHGGMLLQETPKLQETTLTGYTPEELYQGYQAAVQAGDKAAASQLKTMYTDETAYQENNSVGSKKYSEGDKKFLLAKNEAIKAFDILNKGNVTTGKIAAVGSKINEFFGSQDESTTTFKAQLSTARTAARNALLGANMSDAELESYLDAIFGYSNEPKIIKAKLETFIKSLQDYEDSIAGHTADTLTETPPDLY